MSRVMRKHAFCMFNKGADQLCGSRSPDQCLCFGYIGSAITMTF